MTHSPRGSEAYDLSLFEPKQAKIVALKPNKKLEKIQKRRNRIQSVLRVAATLCVALTVVGITGMMISSRVRLTEMNVTIDQQEEELSILKSEYVRITNELSQKASPQAVEEYAQQELGMRQVEPYQIQYVTIDDGEGAAAAEAQPNIFERIGTAIANFFSSLAYLFQ